MAGVPALPWYCLTCSTPNPATSSSCRACGRFQNVTPQQERLGLAFLLNELEILASNGAIDDATYVRLRIRYEQELEEAQRAAAPGAARAAPKAASAPPRPPREGPGWLAEQQANLLLYLGAFLMVIAALIVVGFSQSTSNGIKLVVMLGGTLLFLSGGYFCLRFPRVHQAGIVFFAVGSLMVPLDFVGAYGLFFADSNIDPAGLWLGGSLVCALFYGSVSLLGISRWYAVPATLAVLSALGALLALANAPAEAYPGSFIALAILLSLPSMRTGPASDVFGAIGFTAAHLVVPIALLAALAMAPRANSGFGDNFELATRWYLPPTIAIAAGFYWINAVWPRRVDQSIFAVAALAVTGVALVSLVYAFDVGAEWYGPAVAIVGALYAAGSEGFGPRWFGQRHLGWMALATITGSWLLFEGLYADFPRQGVGVHFGAAIFYLAAAKLWKIDLEPSRREEEFYLSLVPVGLIYAAGLTLGIGFFHLLSSVQGNVNEAADVSMAFFGLSLAIAAAAATMRWWWPEARLHVYGIALGMSLFVSVASATADGQVTIILLVYTVVTLALALWELEPLALGLPAAYGFFTLLAAWRYFEPRDEYLPLVISGAGAALFVVFAALRERLPRYVSAERVAAWTLQVEGAAFAYAIAAPVAGWVRLAVLADDRGFVGADHFEKTLLYQTAAASVFLLAMLALADWWLARRRIEIPIAASALVLVAALLEVGHFHPENAQAYTAPVGAYLLIGALLSLRVRGVPGGLDALAGPIEALGAALIMGPSFLQSVDNGAWGYGLLLLGEGLCAIALALVQRRIWLLSTSIGFVVLDGLHYLFAAGAPPLPNWAILAIAGAAVMAAGTAILLSRERWTAWQQSVRAWWSREPAPSRAA